MSDNVEDLILDLLEWLTSGPRPYVEVLDAWRTSCPRLPIWEEVNDRGFVVRAVGPPGVPCISLSEAGRAHLRAYGRFHATETSMMAGSSAMSQPCGPG